MSYAPTTLLIAMKVWMRHGGANLGIVGGATHTYGYHLGRDRIYSGCAGRIAGECIPGQRGLDYSVQRARDKAGLNDAAEAMDLGPINGKLSQLQAFSRWLVAECRAGAPDTLDIREIIYSPNGKLPVYQWDRERGVDSAPVAGLGDATHLKHTHVSRYRNAENRDFSALFRRYFAGTAPTPPPPSQENDVDLRLFTPAARATVKAGGTAYADPDRNKPIGPWNGGDNIQLAGLPKGVHVKADLTLSYVKDAQGHAPLVCCRVDTESGPGETIDEWYVGADLVSNVHVAIG